MADRVDVLQDELERLSGVLAQAGPDERLALRVPYERLRLVLIEVRNELRLVTLRERDRADNVPCVSCGRTDLPLQYNRRCAECGVQS